MATLEELKRRLYQKRESFEERTHSPDITGEDLKRESEYFEKKSEPSIQLNKIMSSKYFWVVSGLLIAIFLLFFFSNIFDFQNVDIKIESTSDVKSGEKTVFKVVVLNTGKKDLKDASLVFTISNIFRDRIDLGEIKSGKSAEHEFETVIFGGRGKNFEAKALLEYKPEGSSSFFAEENFFPFVIAQSPITISFLMPEEARVGGEVSFKVKYFSQSESKLSDLFLRVDYPSNFKYKNSDPKPVDGNNLWQIGDVDPGEEGLISVSGVLQDIGSSVSNFDALLGSRSGETILSLDEITSSLVSRSPYLGVEILPKGERGDFIASFGEEIPFLVEWKNNLPEIVEDASVEVIFEDTIIDLSSVRVRDGSFVSKDKKIIWNPYLYKDFENVSPGDRGFLSFSFKLKKDITVSSVGKNPILRITSIFKPGKNVPGFEGSTVIGEDKVEIPVSSTVQFSQKGLYFDSPISNTGPLPPKIEKETTYTIIWSLANPLNDVKNLVVKATLPIHVVFKEIFIPSSAIVVYDRNNGTLEWRVDTLEAGTGFIKPALSLSFQVGITPSLTHVGLSPQIISEAEVSGTDSFTEKILTASQSEITIDLRDDPKLDFSQKKVVK